MATRDALVSLAQSARASGRTKDAADLWGRAVASSPGEAVLYHNWAAALGDLRRHAEAAQAIEAGFARGLSAYQSYLVLARAKAGMLQHAEAQDAYRRYLDHAPADAVAHTELAQILWMQTADPRQALAALEDAIARLPDQIDLMVARCRLVGEMGDRAAALAGLQAVLARFGPAEPVLSAASAAAIACGDTAAAVGYAAALVAVRPADSAALSAHAMALVCAGDYPAAQSAIDRLRALDPDNQYHIALQGDLWRLTGHDRARELYDYNSVVFSAALDAPPGWGSAEAYVDDLIAALQARHCYRAEPFFQSVRQGSQISALTSFEDPPLRSFGAAVAGAANRYAQRLANLPGPAGSRGRGRATLASAWSVLLPPDGWHTDHVHPDGWVSSACHLVCDTIDTHSHAGWLKFGQSPLPTSPTLGAEHFIQPQPGVVVFFPSYLWHGTVPIATATRLTVAADFLPA